MSQPDWELVYSTDYSALYRDRTGAYPPELAIADTFDYPIDDDDLDAVAATVYRFSLERCWLVADDAGVFMTNMDPHRQRTLPMRIRAYIPWYSRDLGRVAESVGLDLEELVSQLCTDTPELLVNAYEAIGGYHGYHNLDTYPGEWTVSEFDAWPKRGPRLSTRERDAFVKGYVECALWCGIMRYKHDDNCPCREASSIGDPYDADTCECEPEMVNVPLDDVDIRQMDSRLTDYVRETLTDDAREFYASNVADLRASTLDMSQLGHDFWLTRNRHGAGYSDHKIRGAEPDAALDRLTEAAHAYSEQMLIEDHTMRVGVL